MSYCTTSDLQRLFGAANVTAWSDLSGSGEMDADRIDAAIAYADAYLNDRFGGSRYAVPLVGSGGALVQVVDLAARLAGAWLYESRAGAGPTVAGAGDWSDELAGHRRYVERQINRYLSGLDQLPARRVDDRSAPFVAG